MSASIGSTMGKQTLAAECLVNKTRTILIRQAYEQLQRHMIRSLDNNPSMMLPLPLIGKFKIDSIEASSMPAVLHRHVRAMV